MKKTEKEVKCVYVQAVSDTNEKVYKFFDKVPSVSEIVFYFSENNIRVNPDKMKIEFLSAIDLYVVLAKANEIIDEEYQTKLLEYNSDYDYLQFDRHNLNLYNAILHLRDLTMARVNMIDGILMVSRPYSSDERLS